MRVLLDECVPSRLRQELSEHDVRTVPVRLASPLFDVFITTDQRLSYQQNVPNFPIAVIVLLARRNKLEFLRPLMPEVRRVLSEVRPGEVRRVGV